MTSSWIEELSFNPSTGATMVTKSGRTYEINDISQDEFDAWVDAESVGAHFNTEVEPSYSVRRLSLG
tara:strand:+ start:328 stop:528 length:201 start_codon:yes stop_codon:yes gene_type:complete